MTFSGIVLKLQNLYSQQETNSWQVTVDLNEGAGEIVEKFRKEFVGKENCKLRIENEDNKLEIPNVYAYEGTTRNSSKGVSHKIYFQLPNNQMGRDYFKKIMKFVNSGCVFEIEK